MMDRLKTEDRVVVDARSEQQTVAGPGSRFDPELRELDQEASIPCISLFLFAGEDKEKNSVLPQLKAFSYFPKRFQRSSQPARLISRLCSFVLRTSSLRIYLGTQLCSFWMQRLMMNGGTGLLVAQGSSLVAASSCVRSFSDEDWGSVAWIMRESGSCSHAGKS
jgi:hypothetical protein